MRNLTFIYGPFICLIDVIFSPILMDNSDERILYNGHERISEYIRMPHYVPNEYPNIFGCNIFTERISEYICIPETAQIRIRILFKGNFIQIFEYSYSSLIEGIF